MVFIGTLRTVPGDGEGNVVLIAVEILLYLYDLFRSAR
jgi:hypothetical protein